MTKDMRSKEMQKVALVAFSFMRYAVSDILVKQLGAEGLFSLIRRQVRKGSNCRKVVSGLVARAEAEALRVRKLENVLRTRRKNHGK